ncbi:hypothetical protein HOY82DRAFT_613727 [Tuber indicum]|nr:hypothetical protein HOY82DRAFT_613727 [Tuber indicum]
MCEAGWAEDHGQLVQDARRWPLQANSQTRVVIVLSFQENMPPAPAMVRDEKTTTHNTPDEQALLGSINDTTVPNDLANQLFTLNLEKASEAADDIVETFRTQLLPPPPIDLVDSSS